MSTIATPAGELRALTALPTTLPAVERRAIIPSGFEAASGIAGIKASGRPDLAIVATMSGSDGRRLPAAAAAVFTPNAFAAAPVRLSQAHLAATEILSGGRFGWAAGVVATSGCANAATGAAGDADQAAVAGYLAGALGSTIDETLLLSTGIIGTRLPLDKVEAGIDAIAPTLATSDAALAGAAEALRTTDTRPKAASVSITLPDADGLAVRSVRVTGIAKGVGMIHPRMATMLSIVLTDATVDPATLSTLLAPAAARTWDQLSVDGDTSTNDTVFLLASGAAGSAPITAGTRDALELGRAIEAVARDLAQQQAADGEGASTLVICQVSGAVDDAEARAVARSVVASSLVKAAVHGRDPNWGRIAGAAGNAVLADAAVLAAGGVPPAATRERAGSAAQVDPDRLRIAIGGHLVFDGGFGGPIAFDRAAARAAMDAPELLIRLDLGLGTGTGEGFGCDLTEEYVRENSEYTT
jgi:glutamate N-acetyltransferase/amino-acid N-acetyltransferase